MKKTQFWTILMAVLFLALWLPARQADAAVINLTKVTYIRSVKDLKKVAKNPAGSYKLTKNLNLNSKTWTPIGTTDVPFTGEFDGNNHTIKNLRTAKDADYQGLFSYVKGRTIKNLRITGVVKGHTYVGAFVGQLVDGKISNCVNKAKIYGVNQVGGLVGRTSGSTILNCQNNAAVTGTGRCTGGITSDLYPSGYVYNSVNLGKVSGGNDLNGGITGGSTSGIVANCVNYGNVSGSGRCGAIAGDNASYAGSRYCNYFLKTAKTNSSYQSIGSNCAFFAKATGKLSPSVTINEKNYSKLQKALSAGRSLLRKEKLSARAWTAYNGKIVLYK